MLLRKATLKRPNQNLNGIIIIIIIIMYLFI
jgi:hypothetical protein